MAKVMAHKTRQIIYNRTVNGHFAAEGSSGVRARRYSNSYARKKGKNTVDLKDSGQMLDSMRGSYQFTSKSMDIGVFFTNGKAFKKFQYHQVYGSGKSRIRRRFVYLNKREANQVMRAGIAELKKKN